MEERVYDEIRKLEKEHDIIIAQWFRKEHIESFLKQSLTDEEWQDLKDDDDFWLSIADSESETTREFLAEWKSEKS